MAGSQMGRAPAASSSAASLRGWKHQDIMLCFQLSLNFAHCMVEACN